MIDSNKPLWDLCSAQAGENGKHTGKIIWALPVVSLGAGLNQSVELSPYNILLHINSADLKGCSSMAIELETCSC